MTILLRDRPFNLKGGRGGYIFVFLFRSEFVFRTTRELEYLFFLSRKAWIFFPEFHIRLYDKNSESDCFVSTRIRIFFQQHWESEYFFRKKPYPGADPGFGIRGGVSRGGVSGPLKVPQRFQDRALVGGPGGETPPPLSSGGLRNYIHLFERQFWTNHTIFIRPKKLYF